MVLEILTAAEEEIEAAVREAYAEGYKAAMLQYAPELAVSKSIENSLMRELEIERKKNVTPQPLIYAVIGGLFFAFGIGIHALISK